MAKPVSTCEEKLKALRLPESKEAKIVYFLWLDDQIMELWSDYLTLSALTGYDPSNDEYLQRKILSKLALIDYFEMYLEALRMHIDYNEIDSWIVENNYTKKVIYNRI